MITAPAACPGFNQIVVQALSSASISTSDRLRPGRARMKAESPTISRIVLGLVAAIAISIPLAINVKSDHDLALLEKSARVTDGSITAKHCANHGKITFSYVVEGQLLKKIETCPISCEDTKLGDSIKVIYSAEKPQLASCNAPQPARDAISGNYLALAFVGALAGVVIFRITRAG